MIEQTIIIEPSDKEKDLQRADLTAYIPDNVKADTVHIRADLIPQITKIQRRLNLSKREIWDLFSSSSQIEDKIHFPYFRVDSHLASISNKIWALNTKELDEKRKKQMYNDASVDALSAIAWVEIGFGGLDAFAESPYSINWTTDVGHFVHGEQRIQRIKTFGKSYYNKHLASFAMYRKDQNIHDDVFSLHNCVDILTQFYHSET